MHQCDNASIKHIPLAALFICNVASWRKELTAATALVRTTSRGTGTLHSASSGGDTSTLLTTLSFWTVTLTSTPVSCCALLTLSVGTGLIGACAKLWRMGRGMLTGSARRRAVAAHAALMMFSSTCRRWLALLCLQTEETVCSGVKHPSRTYKLVLDQTR